MTTKRDEFVKLLDECVHQRNFASDPGEWAKARAAVLAAYDAASQPVAGEAPVMHALFGSDGHFIGRVAADSPFGVPLYARPAPKPDAWDRCDACNGTLDDHYAPDQGGCPGFRKDVPPKPDAAAPDGFDCSEVIRTYLALEAEADKDAGDEAADCFNLGKRDGFEDAVQLFDLATGGDGEFKGSTITGETVDVPVMIRRIVDRFSAAPPAPPAAEARDARVWRPVHDDGRPLAAWAPVYPDMPPETYKGNCWTAQYGHVVIDAAMSGSKGAT